jgi:hypothetical protein
MGLHSRARLNMEPESNNNWGGRRIGAGRPTEPSSRRARRRDGEFMARLAFVRDRAGDFSSANVKDWKSPKWNSWEMHSHAIQQTLDDIVLRLDALLGGDARPFEGAEYREWRARRSALANSASASFGLALKS